MIVKNQTRVRYLLVNGNYLEGVLNDWGPMTNTIVTDEGVEFTIPWTSMVWRQLL